MTIRNVRLHKCILKLQQTELQGDVIMWLPASDPCLDAVDDSRLSRRQRNHQPVRHAQEGGDEAGGDGAAHNGVRPGPGQALPAKKKHIYDDFSQTF